MSTVTVPLAALRGRGIEVLPRGSAETLSLPEHCVLESPGSLKRTQYLHSLEQGAFSYQVSGYCFAARIGRYCSFGEEVQIGRQNHPLTWVSTSPAFYRHGRIFALEQGFAGAEAYHDFAFTPGVGPTRVKITTIGHDVWIGHGAQVVAGVTIGTGAIIASGAVVSRDVPPYAVVAGNPAVIKRLRLPTEMVSPMLQSRWWRFAPWQMTHLNPSKPEDFVAGIAAMAGVPDFAPTVTDLRVDRFDTPKP